MIVTESEDFLEKKPTDKVPNNWPFSTYRGVPIDKPVVVEPYFEPIGKPNWENISEEPEATF